MAKLVRECPWRNAVPRETMESRRGRNGRAAESKREGTVMEIWITFFGVVAVGGLLVFLFQRRGGRRDAAARHSLDEAPSLDRTRPGRDRR